MPDPTDVANSKTTSAAANRNVADTRDNDEKSNKTSARIAEFFDASNPHLGNRLPAYAANTDTDAPVTDTGHISGRVMNEQGQPVASVSVLAKPQAAGTVRDGEIEVISDAEGWFLFSDLPSGSYQLQARDFQYDVSSNAVAVSTGTDLVDLMIAYPQELTILGSVTDQRGSPLRDVVIVVSPSEHEPVTSDGMGVFGMRIFAKTDQSYSALFSKQGYRDQRIAISVNDWLETNEVVLNVSLVAERETESVTGVLLSSSGDAIADEQLYLQRQQLKYRARSDNRGHFEFAEVEQGANYTLWVAPGSSYADYRQTGVNVPAGGLSGLEIVLQGKGLGQVQGQALDLQGQPLPNISFMLTVDRFTESVRTGGGGEFQAENVPTGRLRLGTSSQPRLSTSGALVVAGEMLEINPVFDVGTHQFIGTVHDVNGIPVAGARATLHWMLRAGGLLHESLRQALTDENGRFAFTGLGASAHTLTINAPGYLPLEMTIPAARSEADVELTKIQ
ncbi:MAG: carboxypeptidase-like regulatory domain-containing protein [Gammaproteobacteria bacterium]|nr:carboxypeptidase-like regulatory domain-containing protein [Gammaproteobacteria bacterium]